MLPPPTKRSIIATFDPLMATKHQKRNAQPIINNNTYSTTKDTIDSVFVVAPPPLQKTDTKSTTDCSASLTSSPSTATTEDETNKIMTFVNSFAKEGDLIDLNDDYVVHSTIPPPPSPARTETTSSSSSSSLPSAGLSLLGCLQGLHGDNIMNNLDAVAQSSVHRFLPPPQSMLMGMEDHWMADILDVASDGNGFGAVSEEEIVFGTYDDDDDDDVDDEERDECYYDQDDEETIEVDLQEIIFVDENNSSNSIHDRITIIETNNPHSNVEVDDARNNTTISSMTAPYCNGPADDMAKTETMKPEALITTTPEPSATAVAKEEPSEEEIILFNPMDHGTALADWKQWHNERFTFDNRQGQADDSDDGDDSHNRRNNNNDRSNRNNRGGGDGASDDDDAPDDERYGDTTEEETTEDEEEEDEEETTEEDTGDESEGSMSTAVNSLVAIRSPPSRPPPLRTHLSRIDSAQVTDREESSTDRDSDELETSGEGYTSEEKQKTSTTPRERIPVTSPVSRLVKKDPTLKSFTVTLGMLRAEQYHSVGRLYHTPQDLSDMVCQHVTLETYALHLDHFYEPHRYLALLAPLKTSTSIHTVVLEEMTWNRESASAFGTAVSTHPKQYLKTLKLKSCDFLGSAFAVFFLGLQHTDIKIIEIEDCRLGGYTADSLSAALPWMKLEKLTLTNTRISLEGFEFLCQNIGQTESSLKELHFTQEPVISTPRAIRALADAIKGPKSKIESLTLRNCDLDRETIRVLCGTSPHTTELQLVGGAGGLSRNTSITTLDLSQNANVKVDGAAYLIDAMSKNRSLQKLILEGCGIPSDQIAKLRDGIRYNTSFLKHVLAPELSLAIMDSVNMIGGGALSPKSS